MDSRYEYPAMLTYLQPAQAVSVLNDRVKKSAKLTAELADWFAERRKLEDAYVQSLRRLASLKAPHAQADFGVLQPVWDRLCDQLQTTTDAHHQYAIGLDQTIEQVLRHFIASKDVTHMNTLATNLTSHAKTLDEAQERVDKLTKKGPKASTAKVDTATGKLEAAQNQWDSQAPFVMESLQVLDERRMAQWHELFSQYMTLEAAKATSIQTSADAVLALLMGINTHEEIESFASKATNGRLVPPTRRQDQHAEAGAETRSQTNPQSPTRSPVQAQAQAQASSPTEASPPEPQQIEEHQQTHPRTESTHEVSRPETFTSVASAESEAHESQSRDQTLDGRPPSGPSPEAKDQYGQGQPGKGQSSHNLHDPRQTYTPSHAPSTHSQSHSQSWNQPLDQPGPSQDRLGTSFGPSGSGSRTFGPSQAQEQSQETQSQPQSPTALRPPRTSHAATSFTDLTRTGFSSLGDDQNDNGPEEPPRHESSLRSRLGTMLKSRRQSIHSSFAHALSPSKHSGARPTSSRAISPKGSHHEMTSAKLASLNEGHAAFRASRERERGSDSYRSDSYRGTDRESHRSESHRNRDPSQHGYSAGVEAGPEGDGSKDSEGYTVPPATDDPITRAQREASSGLSGLAASAADEGDHAFKLAIKSSPVVDEDPTAKAAAFSRVANTLSTMPIPARKTGTVRGRRDVRHTMYAGGTGGLGGDTPGTGLGPPTRSGDGAGADVVDVSTSLGTRSATDPSIDPPSQHTEHSPTGQNVATTSAGVPGQNARHTILSPSDAFAIFGPSLLPDNPEPPATDTSSDRTGGKDSTSVDPITSSSHAPPIGPESNRPAAPTEPVSGTAAGTRSEEPDPIAAIFAAPIPPTSGPSSTDPSFPALPSLPPSTPSSTFPTPPDPLQPLSPPQPYQPQHQALGEAAQAPPPPPSTQSLAPPTGTLATSFTSSFTPLPPNLSTGQPHALSSHPIPSESQTVHGSVGPDVSSVNVRNVSPSPLHQQSQNVGSHAGPGGNYSSQTPWTQSSQAAPPARQETPSRGTSVHGTGPGTQGIPGFGQSSFQPGHPPPASALPISAMGSRMGSESADSQSIRSGTSVGAASASTPVPYLHTDPRRAGVNASIVEAVTVRFEEGIAQNVHVSGEIALSYHGGGQEEDDPGRQASKTVLVRIDNFPHLESVSPNRSLVDSADPVSSGSPDQFRLALSSLAPKMTPAFSYRVRSTGDDRLAPVAPLLLRPAWKPQGDKLGLLLQYCLNPKTQHGQGVSSMTLHNVVIFATYEGGRAVGAQTKPVGTHLRDRHLVFWRLGDVTLSNRVQKIVCRITGAAPDKDKDEDALPRPGTVEARWESASQSTTASLCGISVSWRRDRDAAAEKDDDPFADDDHDDDDDDNERDPEWTDAPLAYKLVSGKYDGVEGPA